MPTQTSHFPRGAAFHLPSKSQCENKQKTNSNFENAILYRKLGPCKLGPRNQKLRPSSMWYKKPKEVYTCLLTSQKNQNLHRIYFVQGNKPLQYLE